MMRLKVALLILMALIAAPRVSLADDLVASRAAVEAAAPSVPSAPATPVAEPASDDSMSLDAQEFMIGTVALGGAFAIGFIAGGGLASGIIAVSMVAIGYSTLP